MTYSNINEEKNRERIFQTILNLGMAALVAVTLFGCGDFRDDPQSPTPQPHVDPPKTPETPQTPHPQEKPVNPSEEKMNQMCDAERQWALSAGLIDLNQLRLYQGRNYAPVFNTPGERQSGVDGWVPCRRALEINGFVTFSRTEPQPSPTVAPHIDSGTHEQPPPQVPPVLPQTPLAPPIPPPQGTSAEQMNRMCEAERQWALSAGLIDLNQLRLFQSRNFAPVFNTPGERQSGVDGWVPCARALELNGFIRR